VKVLRAPVLIVALGACASSHHGAQSSPSASPSALGSCETRVMTVDGAEIVVTANVNGSLASVEIVNEPNHATGTRAVDDAVHAFGPVRRDSRVVARQSKWGLATLTDPCGRPVPLPSR
jgi:hypothetical protein